VCKFAKKKIGAGETFVPRVQRWLCKPDSRQLILLKFAYQTGTL
jgi:hypothetical protein